MGQTLKKSLKIKNIPQCPYFLGSYELNILLCFFLNHKRCVFFLVCEELEGLSYSFFNFLLPWHVRTASYTLFYEVRRKTATLSGRDARSSQH